MVSVCVADDVVLPWYFSFMDVRCDLSAKNARVFGLIRRSLSPGGTGSDGGCGIVMSSSCSFAVGFPVCLAGGERRIIISAGRLAGASGMSPVGSITVSYAVLVRLVNVSRGRSAIVNVLVIASCRAVLDVRRHPNAWSPYLSNVVPHMHLWWLVGLVRMGSRSFRCTSSVNDSLLIRFDGSLRGRLWRAMLVNGLSRLGRNRLMSFVSSGICWKRWLAVRVWYRCRWV